MLPRHGTDLNLRARACKKTFAGSSAIAFGGQQGGDVLVTSALAAGFEHVTLSVIAGAGAGIRVA